MSSAPLVARMLTFAATLALCTALSTTALAQPVADWQFNEVGQIVNDASSENNDGVLGMTGAAEGTDPTRILSLFGDAVNFAGGQFVTVPSSSSLEPAQVTVEGWVRSSSGGGGAFSYVLSKGASDCDAGSYGMFVSATGGLVFMIYDGTSFYVSADAGASIWDGAWHHVAGLFDGVGVSLYVDGNQVGTATPAPIAINYSLPTSDDLYIGAFRGSCELFFTGDIDAVRIWPRPLDPGEISQAAAEPPVAVQESSVGTLKAGYNK